MLWQVPTLQSSGAVAGGSILAEYWAASFNGNVKEQDIPWT